jgi:hypothetical protein
MRSSPDDFRGLRSLLKLKRYEQPPNRYFDGLSQDVLHRLRGPEGLREQSLLVSLGFRFGLKPALFYGLGAVCCLLAFYGVAALFGKTPPLALQHPEAGASLTRATPGVSDPPAGGIVGSGSASEDYTASTNPVMSSGSVSFPLEVLRVKPTPARYQPK